MVNQNYDGKRQASDTNFILTALLFSFGTPFLEAIINLLIYTPSKFSSLIFISKFIVSGFIAYFLLFILLNYIASLIVSFFPPTEKYFSKICLSFFLSLIFLLIGFGNTFSAYLSTLFPIYKGLSPLFKLSVLFLFCLLLTKCLCFLSKPFLKKQFSFILWSLTPLFLSALFLIWLPEYYSNSLLLDNLLALAVTIMFLPLLILVIFYLISYKTLAFHLVTSMLLLALISFLFIFSRDGKKYEVQKNVNAKNIILITVDTLRADTLSCYGNKNMVTPNIDSLASDGILFKRAFSSSPWTLPSFVSIMTGLSPDMHLIKTGPAKMNDNIPTLASYLKNKGYATAGIGDNLYLKPESGLARGFEEYAFFPKPTYWIGSSFVIRMLGWTLPKQFPQFMQEVTTEGLTNIAIEWLNDNNNRPFFLWLHYYDPHFPYAPPLKYTAGKTPPRGWGRAFIRLENTFDKDYFESQEEKKWIKYLYDSEVKYVDDSIGKFINELKRLNIYDTSLIVFSSDHGEEFWEHGGSGHGSTLYNELLNVPLIIKTPDKGIKRSIATNVSLEQIMPTILDFCEIDYNPNYLPAPSLYPQILNPEEEYKSFDIVSTGLLYGENRESIIFEEMKYIRTLVSHNEELYNISDSLDEDISLSIFFPEEIDRANKLLKNHQKKSEFIRKHYNIVENTDINYDADALDKLKAVGYIQ